MDKRDHGSQSNVFGDDMRVLKVLVEEVHGLMPVSGSALELGLPDPELLDAIDDIVA